MLLDIKNDSDSEKKLKVFPYVEWCLWDADDDQKNFQRNLSTGEVEIESNLGYEISGLKKPASTSIDNYSELEYAAIYHHTEYRERRNMYAVFSVNRPIDGFDTDRRSFIGDYRSPALPEVVENGSCKNTVASGWSPCAVYELDITLAPGESTSVIFQLTYVENPVDEKWESYGVINKTRARAMIRKYHDRESVIAAYETLRSYWGELLSKFHVKSSRPEVDRMVNIWNQYKCMITFNMSRSASDYQSGIGSGFNDDPLWLIAAVSAYIRETGVDKEVDGHVIPYVKGQKEYNVEVIMG